MQIYKIALSSWTASFRYSNIISGTQPSYRVPPLSTIIGLISSAKGDFYIPPSDFKIAFYFDYSSIAWDVETIYYWDSNTKSDPKTGKTKYDWKVEKSNIINREQMFDCRLFLYTTDKEIFEYFHNPVFPLVLGRSTDLATIDEVCEVDLDEKDFLENVKGTIIPFKAQKVTAAINSLPIQFTDEIPRKIKQADTFFIIDPKNKKNISIKAKGFNDNLKDSFKNDIDLYWQEIVFTQ